MSRFTANARVVAALGARSVKQTFRRPQLASPILVFPTLLLAVQTGGAGEVATSLPGWDTTVPTDDFLSFLLAGAILQSCLLAGNTGGIALAVDLEMGFTDRLFVAPVSRFAIVLGRLAGVGALGALTAVWFIALGLIFGAEFEQGVPGMLVMVALTSLAAAAFGGLSAAIALYSGQASVVQGLFPLVFVILFLSSAFFPTEFLHQPAKAVAEYNPLSFIVEGVREPVISSLTAESLAEAFGAVALIAAISIGLSAAALRRRLRIG
ncbi:MAG TPA: ABC transporter permease [Solirubrobacterales bacterium]|nr:ABC transporter permease [Solirubrobacterales bacterium]